MQQQTRRSFLKATAAGIGAGAVALGTAPAILRAGSSTKPGAKRTLALMGCGWWGGNILHAALADGRVKLAALCDVDQAQLKKCADEVRALTSESPKTYTDYRELLAREKPQIVIVATPDHWHPLITIAAVQSGAHVYVEKPVSHTVLEGAAMLDAARQTGRTVQVGTHRRVSPHNISAREFLRSGKAGKIGMVRCFVNNAGGAEKPHPNQPASAGLDWDMWCGPAPLRPFNTRIHPRGFRQFLDYANGQLGDWGIHWLDQAMWIMDRQHPRTVYSTGGRPIKGPPVNTAVEQTSDAPDHQVVAYDFDDLTVTWEHRLFAGSGRERDQWVGADFYGTAGVFHLGWQDGWTFYPTDASSPAQHQDAQFSGKKDSENIAELWRDFIDAIDQNRRPVSDIETGYLATTAALLGMLSLKLHRSIRWDGPHRTIAGDPEASALLKRTYRAPWQYPV
jgi:predicted dehydrogenase